MKLKELKESLQEELYRTYHNATLNSNLTCESDYESDLVQSQVEMECSEALSDLKYSYPEILSYGKVYSYGRGGRTLAPESLIDSGGGVSFRVKEVENLELSYNEMRKLLRVLTKFNDLVEDFCKNVIDSSIEFIREEHSKDIEENKDKKRQHYSGVRYV